jgi:hypothetical protein
MNAVSKTAIITSPEKMRLDLLHNDGSIQEISFNDTPVNRIIFAMKERYGEIDTAKYVGAISRILALLDMLTDRRLAEWIEKDKDDSKSVKIHSALIEAAAVTRLKRNGNFSRREFLRNVRELVNTKYRGQNE